MTKVTKRKSTRQQSSSPLLTLSLDQLKALASQLLDEQHEEEKLRSKAAINEARAEAETDIVASLRNAMRRNDVRAIWIGSYYDVEERRWVPIIDQYSFGHGQTFSPASEKHLERRLLAARQQVRLPIETRKRPVGVDRARTEWDQGDLDTIKRLILRYPKQPPQSMIAIVAEKYLVTRDLAAEVVIRAFSELKRGIKPPPLIEDDEAPVPAPRAPLPKKRELPKPVRMPGGRKVFREREAVDEDDTTHAAPSPRVKMSDAFKLSEEEQAQLERDKAAVEQWKASQKAAKQAESEEERARKEALLPPKLRERLRKEREQA